MPIQTYADLQAAIAGWLARADLASWSSLSAPPLPGGSGQSSFHELLLEDRQRPLELP
jgi:hypothetical protein